MNGKTDRLHYASYLLRLNAAQSSASLESTSSGEVIRFSSLEELVEFLEGLAPERSVEGRTQDNQPGAAC